MLEYPCYKENNFFKKIICLGPLRLAIWSNITNEEMVIVLVIMRINFFKCIEKVWKEIH